MFLSREGGKVVLVNSLNSKNQLWRTNYDANNNNFNQNKVWIKSAYNNYHLSHAFNKIWLQNGNRGDGELWVKRDAVVQPPCESGQSGWPKCKGVKSERLIAFLGKGGESSKYLSHANNKTWMQNGNKGDGEVWRVTEYNDGKVSIEALGGEEGKFLSRNNGKVKLVNNVVNENQLWRTNYDANNSNFDQNKVWFKSAVNNKHLSHAFSKIWL